MSHIMLDLETWGKKPGCGLISIGAVEFSFETGVLGKEFYSAVNHSSCILAGLKDDKQTLEWWDKQSMDAKSAYQASNNSSSVSIRDALVEFGIFLESIGKRSNVRLWGNGADFDNNVLGACYDAVGLSPPWGYYNNRCYRTLRSLCHVIDLVRVGTHHNALDDAKTQAAHAIKIHQHLNLSKEI